MRSSWPATSSRTSPTGPCRPSSAGSPPTWPRAGTSSRGSGSAGSLPPNAAPVAVGDYDRWARAAGLTFIGRWSTWDRQPFTTGSDYALTVHRLFSG